jgi:hypothetical protein
MKTTLRKCIGLVNALEQLKTMGNFTFRCAVVGAGIIAKQKVEQFNELQKPSAGIATLQEEIRLHKENCTKEKDGKKTVDVAAFIPLFEKAQEKHLKAIQAAEKLQKEANKELDKEIEIDIKPIQLALIQEADDEERIPALLLSAILPFAS